MAKKGINYALNEAKEELLQTCNSMISRGVPVVALELMLINLSTSISEVSKSIINKEQDEYSNALQKEAEEERLKEEQNEEER